MLSISLCKGRQASEGRPEYPDTICSDPGRKELWMQLTANSLPEGKIPARKCVFIMRSIYCLTFKLEI